MLNILLIAASVTTAPITVNIVDICTFPEYKYHPQCAAQRPEIDDTIPSPESNVNDYIINYE